MILFTFSRAVIGFGLALIIRAAHRRGTRRARAAAALAAALAVFSVVGLTVSRVYPDLSEPSATRVTVPFQESGMTGSTTSRRRSTRSSSIPSSAPDRTRFPATSRVCHIRAHFTPLNVAATMGLPAFAALVGLIVALWRQRRRPTDVTIWSGLAGLGVDAIGQDVEHFRHVWIMLGLADADRREGRRRTPGRTSGTATW